MSAGSGHQPLKIALIILTLLALLVIFVINGLSSSSDNPIFNNSTADLSDKYYTGITPSGWAFSIWGVIYALQAVWVLYAVTSICRSGIDGPLYCSPPYLPLAIYPIYIINLGLNAGWLILFDREELIAALVVLALTAFTLYVCFGLSLYGINKYGEEMIKSGLKKDVWIVRVAVENAFAIYATWTSIATLLNFAMVLIYKTDKDPLDAEWREDVGTICLGILSLEVLIWVITDLTVLERLTRYVITPHLVVTFALAAILAKNYESGSRNTTMEIVMLSAAGVATLIKLAVMIWRTLASRDDHQLV